MTEAAVDERTEQRVLRQLLHSEEGPWWLSKAWLFVKLSWATEPLVVVLDEMAETMWFGEPTWVAGGDGGPEAAVRRARKWVESGVNPHDIQCWFGAGCWSPEVATMAMSSGLKPEHFLDDNGSPHTAIDRFGREAPLLQAVALGTLTFNEALSRIEADRTMPKPYRVRVGWHAGNWTAEITTPLGLKAPLLRAPTIGEVVREACKPMEPDAYLQVTVNPPSTLGTYIERARFAQGFEIDWSENKRKWLDEAGRELSRLGISREDIDYLLSRAL